MAKYKRKFFLDGSEDYSSSTSSEKRTKNKKTNDKRSDKKGISFYGEKINYYFKNWMPVIIIVILLVIAFLFIRGCNNSKNNNKPKNPSDINSGKPVVVDSITINLNQEIPKISSFVKNYSKIKTDKDTITYDQQNLVDNKYIAVGNYKVKISLDGVEYSSRIIVIDKEPPVFAVKDVTINEGSTYTINDFVTSCSDNSGKECVLDYEKTEYGKLTSPGTYTIGIIASDLSGNKAKIQNVKLTINSNNPTPTPTPNPTPNPKPNPTPNPKPNTKTCNFGSTNPAGQHVVTYSVVKDKCPVDKNLAKTDTYASVLQQLQKTGTADLDKLKQEINNKNITMKIYFVLNVVPVFNTENKGLVGYSLYINAYEVVHNDKTGKDETGRTIISYDINPNGSRKYIVNELGL